MLFKSGTRVSPAQTAIAASEKNTAIKDLHVAVMVTPLSLYFIFSNPVNIMQLDGINNE
jgi:hypothetical protein